MALELADGFPAYQDPVDAAPKGVTSIKGFFGTLRAAGLVAASGRCGSTESHDKGARHDNGQQSIKKKEHG